MNMFTLLLLIIIAAVGALVIRRMVHAYRQPKFPIFSITMLSISLMMLIGGIILSLQVSDAIGGTVSTVGGFFGMLESHVRNKREAAAKEQA